MSLGNPCTFLLVKEKTWKRIFNTKRELPQNRTEKQIMPSKTTINRLFNEIWCYLIIACFEWKIDVFQQTVVRDYFTLKKLVIERVYSLLGSLTISICQVQFIIAGKLLVNIYLNLTVSLKMNQIVLFFYYFLSAVWKLDNKIWVTVEGTPTITQC